MPAVVLWDGECGFCRRGIGWFARKDTGGAFEFTAYQDSRDPRIDDAMRERCAETMHLLLEDGTVLTGAASVLYLTEVLIVGAPARWVRNSPLRIPLEWMYGWVAKNRRTVSKYLFRTETGGPLG